MTEPKPVPREVQARIVEDLARGHRSIASIAARHHVPADLVFKLRDIHGPGLADLSEAARKLRRPVLDAVPDVDAAAVAVLDDGLTVDDEDDDAPAITCESCGDPLADTTVDVCPDCDAESEQVSELAVHLEWATFYAECLTIPELATECEAVAAAVYRLRDAHAEHQVRLVLDAIEAS